MEDPDQFKLFVGGISRETTEEALKEHFGLYGTVVSCVIAKDRLTGIPRGFAFVSFSDPSGVDDALNEVSHVILGRTVEVRKAIPRSEYYRSQQEQNFRTRKIFVGGLPANLTEEEFKVYFEQFGSITDVVVMHDNMNRPRGFGFITFDSEEAVEHVMLNNFHELNCKLVEVKKAVPRAVNGPNTRNGSWRGSNLNSYPQGIYPMYSPNGFPYHGSFYGYGYGYGGIAGYYGYGGGYPSGGYSGIGYGPLWRVGPLPYGSPAYLPFMNGGDGLPYGSPAYRPFMNGGDGPASTGNSSQVSDVNDQVVVQNDKNVDVSLSSTTNHATNGGDGLTGIATNGYNGIVGAAGNDQVVVRNDRNVDVSLSSGENENDGGELSKQNQSDTSSPSNMI